MSAMNRAEWNLHADEFESLVCDIVEDETGDQMRRFVNAACKSRKNLVLVDLGCGLGSFVRKFGDRFCEIIAVDFAARIVARAKMRCARTSNVTWLATGIRRSADLIGSRADLTVCLNVITSPNEARRNEVWSSIAAVTRPSGFALIVVPSIKSQRMVEGSSRPRDGSPSGNLVERDGVLQKHYSRSELISTVLDRGFTVKRLERISYPWSVDGLRKPRCSRTSPWDWICLIQRVA